MKSKKDLEQKILADKQQALLKNQVRNLQQENKYISKENDKLKKELEMSRVVKPTSTFEIKNYVPSGDNEATPIIVASDWHLGETITLAEVNGLNQYNEKIARARAIQFFQGSLRITQILNKDIPIKNCVLALLGDFINNMMFEEAMETNYLLPVKEVMFAQEIIASGIEYYLKNSKYNFTIVCHSGNHGRATKKPRNGENEAGHSFEFLLYQNLANHFKYEKRVTFIIPESYLSYLKIYDKVIAFHHGHNVRYMGGIGGITIPMFKALGQWEQAKHADVYVNGHFHQLFDAGSFITNGSMVGWNSYSVAIKAKYEEPKQVLFLMDKNRGKTITAPICFDI